MRQLFYRKPGSQSTDSVKNTGRFTPSQAQIFVDNFNTDYCPDISHKHTLLSEKYTDITRSGGNNDQTTLS